MCLLVWVPTVLHNMLMDCTVCVGCLKVHMCLILHTHTQCFLRINDKLSVDTRMVSRFVYVNIEKLIIVLQWGTVHISISFYVLQYEILNSGVYV